MNLTQVGRHRTLKLTRSNKTHEVLAHAIEALGVVGVENPSLLPNRLTGNMSTKNLFQRRMDSGLDNTTQLSINFLPSRTGIFRDRFNLSVEMIIIVLAKKPKLDVGSPSVIVGAVQLVNGERGSDIVGKQGRLRLLRARGSHG